MGTKRASRAGANRVTAQLDSVASLFQHHYASLGIPKKVAMDMAYRLDLVSDSIDRRKAAGYFDPSEIGEEVPGPLMYDENNPFMEGEFTQERFNALEAKQVSGELAANAAKHVADPKLASFVKEVAFNAAMAMAKRMAAEAGPEEEEEKESAEEEDSDKEAKTAALARAYNKLRREMMAAESKAEEEEAEEEEVEEEGKEAKKVASFFKLFR